MKSCAIILSSLTKYTRIKGTRKEKINKKGSQVFFLFKNKK